MLVNLMNLQLSLMHLQLMCLMMWPALRFSSQENDKADETDETGEARSVRRER